MKNHYTANLDSIGEWASPEQAVALWNARIAPVLVTHTAYDDATGETNEPAVSVGGGFAKPAAEWAWDEFCGRGAGDDESICADLAAELAHKIG